MISDLTIETALADPMIRAMMRADHVEPKSFETLLRSQAQLVEHRCRGQRTAITTMFGARSFKLLSDGLCCA